MMSCVARGKHTGFTLIEIMIVIAIIAILAGIVVPNIAMARAEAKLAACKENILAIANVVHLYLVRKPDLTELWRKTKDLGATNAVQFFVDEGYTDHIPLCPASGKAYWFAVPTIIPHGTSIGVGFQIYEGAPPSYRHKMPDGRHIKLCYYEGQRLGDTYSCGLNEIYMSP